MDTSEYLFVYWPQILLLLLVLVSRLLNKLVTTILDPACTSFLPIEADTPDPEEVLCPDSKRVKVEAEASERYWAR